MGKNTKARFNATLHLLDGLPPHLFALELSLSCNNGFKELTLGRVIKLEVQTFNCCAAGSKSITQIKMEAGVAGKTFQIVKYDHVGFVWLSIDEAQESLHAGAFHKVHPAGYVIGEYGFDIMAIHVGMGTAATSYLSIDY